MRLQALIVVAVLVLALTGCCTPEVVVDTQYVNIPVIEPCDVQAPKAKDYATDAVTADSTDFEKIRALLVERRQRMSTEEELRLLLDACTAPLNN